MFRSGRHRGVELTLKLWLFNQTSVSQGHTISDCLAMGWGHSGLGMGCAGARKGQYWTLLQLSMLVDGGKGAFRGKLVGYQLQFVPRTQ